MDEKLHKILNKINLDEKYFNFFFNAKLNKTHIDELENIILVEICNDNDIPYILYNELVNRFYDYFKDSSSEKIKIKLRIINKTSNSDNFKENFEYIIKDRYETLPNIYALKDKFTFFNNNLDVVVVNEREKFDILKEFVTLSNLLSIYGTVFNYNTIVDDNLRVEIDEEIITESKKIESIPYVERKEVKKNTVFRRRKKDVDERTIFGNRIPIDDPIIKIHNIVGESEDIVIEAKVFGNKEFVPSSKAFKILTLKVTDNSDSILAKIFVRDFDIYDDLLKKTKNGTWLKLKGYTKYDEYEKNELVFNVNDIYESDRKDEKLVDDAETKRVELHAHTMMSQMDGVTKLDLDKHTCELITNAIDMGYPAVAVTDHSGCQAFPIMYELITKSNKSKLGKIKSDKKELEEKIAIEENTDQRTFLNKELEEVNEKLANFKPFKGLYGTELTLVDDTVNIVIRPSDLPLLDTEYVVFDTETTGFNAAGGDQMIEIGAVKIKNGEITDKFDELIDPKRPIPKKITELTNITDEMVKGKESEEEVTKKFLSWAGVAPMVAHNAKFDISFIEMSMKKYNLGEFKNTVIDTLELSRTMDQGYARHSLSALVSRYNVDFDEEGHHRADYDAEGTAKVFYKMLQKLANQNFKKISDLDRLISKDEIHKFGRTFHFNAIALNKEGLKNLFKIISLANTTYLYKTPRILRSKLNELRSGILIGSGCYNSEVFIEARSKEGEELTNIINFYDYVEVQPPEVYNHLIQTGDFKDEEELEEHIKKVISATKEAGKIIVATGDVHHFYREDKIYREVIINQKVPGGGRHPLAKKEITYIPSQHFRTTNEMLENFNFLDKDLAYEIVVTNTNKIADMVLDFEVIPDTGGVPFSPRVKSDDGKSYLDCPKVVTDLVFTKANEWYGNPLPHNIEERIAKELYGDIVYNSFYNTLKKENADISEEELLNKTFEGVHKTVSSGFDKVKEVVKAYLKNNWDSVKDGDLTDESLNNKLKKSLGGIIGGGFDPIYLIAQRLVKHSNDDGYLVGSRGSVGSSLVAGLMGISEVNPLPPHYRCPKCKKSIFEDIDGKALGATYLSGFDLPDMNCPNCQEKMLKDGQDIPFATFLGFNADKVPDIDLNFSDLNQADAHEYTKVLFGVDNVYRAGTIGTVADKTAYGFVLGYYEDKIMDIINEIAKSVDKTFDELLNVDKKEKVDIIAKKFLLKCEDLRESLPDNILDKYSEMIKKVKEYSSISSAEIERIALGCTGVKRTTGQHPGGIVVVPDYKDVSDFTPFQFPADDPTSAWRTTHFSYHAIDQCLLKLDILGHSDPTQLRMIQDLTKMDVSTVPMDDKETMSIFSSTKALGVTTEQILNNTGTLGIPEFGTNFTISMVEDTKPKTFAELIKISGLSHGTDVWLGNAQELIRNNVVPFKDVIGCRDDIMVYLIYHGLPPIKAFKIMEFVRKGKASKEKDAWLEHKKTMQDAGIESWFIDSCEKIKYMFPKAHATAYVTSAFRIAWYKVHMPVYFYASWLTSKATDVDVLSMIKGYNSIREKILEIQAKGFDASNKETGQLESLKVCLEATARGINFLNVDLLKSEATTWGVLDEKNIYPPFAAIDGLGDTVAKAIVEEREKRAFTSIEDLQKRAKISQTLIDKLRKMHILDGLDESDQLSLF